MFLALFLLFTMLPPYLVDMYIFLFFILWEAPYFYILSIKIFLTTYLLIFYAYISHIYYFK